MLSDYQGAATKFVSPILKQKYFIVKMSKLSLSTTSLVEMASLQSVLIIQNCS